MKKKIPSQNLYQGNYGWHTGCFHFPFADYEDPNNGPFGVLKALNEFKLDPNTGFETHPHDEMEIISYCVDGVLEHADNMGNKGVLKSGDWQYLCAGSGVTHREGNARDDSVLRFLQIWITPNKGELTPKYQLLNENGNFPRNELRLIVSGEEIESAIRIQQDANIYVAEVDEERQIKIINKENRQAYILCLEGRLAGGGVDINSSDALKLWGKEDFILSAVEKSHILMIEMEEFY